MPVGDSPMETLYKSIKRYAPKMRKDRRLQVPPARTASVHSNLCGSKLTLDAEIVDGRVTDIGYRVRACSLGQASTAIVVQRAIGMDAEGVARVQTQLESLLAGSLDPDTALEWPELGIFRAVTQHTSRHGSILLPFVALNKLFVNDKASVKGPVKGESL